MKKLDFFKYAVLTALVVFFAAGCGDTGGDDDKTSYTLTFNSQGGTSVSPITQAAGTNINLPSTSRNGYTFNGWYSAATGGTRYGGSGDSYTIAYANITMYAQWTAISSGDGYTLTFDSQGGSGVSAMSGTSGTSVNLPAPTRNGYTFNGWYSAATGGIKYNNPYTITGNITMYAQWTAVVVVGDGDTTINGIACKLVRAGTFNMGSPKSEEGRYPDETQHQVTLTQDYWLSKYPITNSQYGKAESGKENHPVVNVTWAQADDWAKSKGGRLPTEAEWEFAARGGNRSDGYIYSGSNNLDNVAWYISNSGGGTKPVGQKRPNELGIYDMSGNVFEWCSDWYGEYSTSVVTNPTGPNTGNYHVVRGGYYGYGQRYCRVAFRYSYNSSDPTGISEVGFRVAFPRD